MTESNYNKMSQLVNSVTPSLGSTPEGRAWCMKALNPAAPLNVLGIPDGDVSPRVVQNYERILTIDMPLAANNWSCDILLHGNPLNVGAYRVDDGVTPSILPITNPQLGAGDTAQFQYLWNNVEAYRLVSCSVTAVLDATSTTDSGSVAATQFAIVPKLLSLSDSNVYNQNLCLVPAVECWPDTLKPYDDLVQMPGAYTGKAKEGVYIPLRLDLKDEWKHPNEARYAINTSQTHLWNFNLWNSVPSAMTPVTEVSWPYGVRGTYANSGGLQPFRYMPKAQDTSAQMSFRNLNPSATLKCTVRTTIEYKVTPGSQMTPNLTLSPPYDPSAIAMYKLVANSLKLAYPADYNDWQKIVKTIADIARVITKTIPVLSPLTPAIDLGEKGIQALIKARRQRIQAKARPSKPNSTK